MIHSRSPRLALLLLGSLLLACGGGGGSDAPLGPPFVRDELGRAVILRGVNVMNSSKGDPERLPSIVREDVDRMAQAWGFDFVRFLIFWDAVEPSPGVYDEAYLARVEERLDWFADAGILVLLDMHQDVYASRFCCDGAPEWAIRDDGEPFELQDLWAANYFQPAVKRAFDNFWAGDEGAHGDLQEHFAEAWAVVAARLGGHPAVVGYDVINEPHPGSAFDVLDFGRDDPEGRSATFDRERLGPFYQRVIDRIREVDSDRWIFFEPRYGAPGDGAASYLPVLRDPRRGEDRLVWAPHMYSFGLEATGRYSDRDDSVARWEARRAEDVARQGAPLVLGEWGLSWTTEGAERFADDLLDAADRLMAGWAYWSYDPGSWGFWEPDTQEESASIGWLVRPYPRRVAGDPTSFGYDRQARVFRLSFVVTGDARGDTEIYLPASRYYPDGYVVDVSGPEAASTDFDAARDVLRVTTLARGVYDVEIRPAP